MMFLFQGSELRGLDEVTVANGLTEQQKPATLTLQFSAACVWHIIPSGGQAIEEAYLQPLDLVLEQATLAGDAADGIGALSEGVLQVGDERLTCMPLPWVLDTPFRLSLQFRNGTHWTLHAQRGRCIPGPGARLVTSYAC